MKYDTPLCFAASGLVRAIRMPDVAEKVAAQGNFVIGDTPRDIHAGHEAGFRTVGVATSDYTIDDLKAAGADVVLSDFEQDRSQLLRIAGID